VKTPNLRQILRELLADGQWHTLRELTYAFRAAHLIRPERAYREAVRQRPRPLQYTATELVENGEERYVRRLLSPSMLAGIERRELNGAGPDAEYRLLGTANCPPVDIAQPSCYHTANSQSGVAGAALGRGAGFLLREGECAY
jgi:hypothetical protein